MTSDELNNHEFTRALFEAVRPVMASEHEYHQSHVRAAEYIPDEYEFYVLRVGNRLATLISQCRGLEDAVLFMSAFRQTRSMAVAGINRTRCVRYSMENYIIRTQTLYDVVLKLVDAVFHLTNADSQCRDGTIIQNLKVKRSEVPARLKPLRRKLTEFESARHNIIHHGGYHDDQDLYRLELYTEVEDSHARSGDDLPDDLRFVPAVQAELTREFIRNRKAQYRRFNDRVIDLVSDVLAALLDPFSVETHSLRILTGRETTGSHVMPEG